MSDLNVLNITCFQTQTQLTALNNIEVLLKGDLTDLRARNFVHAKISFVQVAHTVKSVIKSCLELYILNHVT